MFVVMLALAACLAGPLPAAWAHATLEKSDPAAGATLPGSPSQVVLTFGEEPDPQLSLIRIVDQNGDAVPGASPAELVPGEPLQLRVTLSQTLPTGVYSVNWLSVSATDGHVSDGVFAFGVNVKPRPGTTVQVTLRHTSTWIDALGIAGRWLLYLGLVLLLGAAAAGLFVFGARPAAGGRGLLVVALIAAAAGLCLLTASERLAVGAPSLLPLFVTSEGQLLVWLGAALVACAVAVILLDFWPGRPALIGLAVTAAIAVFFHVWAGHADAPATLRPLNLTEQWVHVLAIGAWVGGLVWLLRGIRGPQQPERAAAVRAFSRLATVALIAVLVTGALRAVTELGSFGALFSTSYGVTLVVKVGIVVVLVALGAVNHFRLVPGLQLGDGAYRPFRLNSRVELIVAAAVLVATAVLVGLAPPIA